MCNNDFKTGKSQIAMSIVKEYPKENIHCLGVSYQSFIELLVSGACQYNTKKVIVQGIGKIKRECEYFPGLECKGKEIAFF